MLKYKWTTEIGTD